MEWEHQLERREKTEQCLKHNGGEFPPRSRETPQHRPRELRAPGKVNAEKTCPWYLGYRLQKVKDKTTTTTKNSERRKVKEKCTNLTDKGTALSPEGADRSRQEQREVQRYASL